MAFISEADIEQIVLEQFAALGYATAHGTKIAPDSKTSERESFSDSNNLLQTAREFMLYCNVTKLPAIQ